MYDDHLEIYSPGGVYRGKPVQECGPDEINSVRRNSVIADLFRRMKLMERRGNDIRKILEFCEEPRNKREICKHLGFNNLTYFTCTYLNPKNCLE